MGGKGGGATFFPPTTENSGIKVLSSLFFDQKKGPENKTEKKWVFLLRGKKWETRQYCFLPPFFEGKDRISIWSGAAVSPWIFAFLATSRLTSRSEEDSNKLKAKNAFSSPLPPHIRDSIFKTT